MSNLVEITEQFKRMAANIDPIGGRVKFELDTGCVLIDGTGAAHVVSNEATEADCTVKMTEETFLKMKAGDLNPMMAMMTGKIKVSGDTGLALKLQKLMG